MLVEILSNFLTGVSLFRYFTSDAHLNNDNVNFRIKYINSKPYRILLFILD